LAAFDLKSNGADKEAHAEKHTSKLLISQVKMRAIKSSTCNICNNCTKLK